MEAIQTVTNSVASFATLEIKYELGPAVRRDLSGKWLPGGAPFGARALPEIQSFRAAARAHLQEILLVVVGIATNPATHARDRLEASKLIMSYGAGTPDKTPELAEDAVRRRALEALTDEELRSLAFGKEIVASSHPATVTQQLPAKTDNSK